MPISSPLPRSFTSRPGAGGLGGWGGLPLRRLEGRGDRLEDTARPRSREEWGRPGRWG